MTLDQITARTLRNADWKPVYTYDNGRNSYAFTTYACDALPGITITKEARGTKRVRLNTVYQFQGRKTDSPTQLVRYWNEAARAARSGGSAPPGSPQQARRTRGGAGV